MTDLAETIRTLRNATDRKPPAEWTVDQFGASFIEVQRMSRNELRTYARRLEAFAADRCDEIRSLRAALHREYVGDASSADTAAALGIEPL